MDLGLYFVIAIAMALATWLVSEIFRYETKQKITTIVGLAIVLPLLIIFLFGAAGILQDPESAQVIESSTMEAITDYVGGKLPYIVISDIAGIIAGSIMGYLTRREE